MPAAVSFQCLSRGLDYTLQATHAYAYGLDRRSMVATLNKSRWLKTYGHRYGSDHHAKVDMIAGAQLLMHALI